MDQEFIKLMQILLGNPNPSMPSSSHKLNPDYAAAINNHVVALNAGLGIAGRQTAFIGNHQCAGNARHSSPVIAPVVFASSYNGAPLTEEIKPFKFAVFGLNPLFNIVGNSVCEEKGLAGNVLGNYAAFYNSKSCTPAGVFPFVLNPMSPYYRNIFRVFNSLYNGKFIPWSIFAKLFPTNNQKATEYKRIIIQYPIIVAELIPFHSKKTSTIDIDVLHNCNLNYRDYHNELFNILDKKLATNGILFSHGKAASAALRQILHLKGVAINIVRNSPKYEFAIWNKRLIIILDHFLSTVNGVNSDEDYTNLIKDVIAELIRLRGLKILSGLTYP